MGGEGGGGHGPDGRRGVRLRGGGRSKWLSDGARGGRDGGSQGTDIESWDGVEYYTETPRPQKNNADKKEREKNRHLRWLHSVCGAEERTGIGGAICSGKGGAGLR